MGGHHGHRVMVRTCNGLELRDPSLFVETSASELVESSVLFPSVDSRDELHPRCVSRLRIFLKYKKIITLLRCLFDYCNSEFYISRLYLTFRLTSGEIFYQTMLCKTKLIYTYIFFYKRIALNNCVDNMKFFINNLIISTFSILDSRFSRNTVRLLQALFFFKFFGIYPFGALAHFKTFLLSVQGVGGSKFRKHVSYPRFASGNGRAAATAPDRGERRRSL